MKTIPRDTKVLRDEFGDGPPPPPMEAAPPPPPPMEAEPPPPSDGGDGPFPSEGEYGPEGPFPSEGEYGPEGPFPFEGEYGPEGPFPPGGEFGPEGPFPPGGEFGPEGPFPPGGEFGPEGPFPPGGEFGPGPMPPVYMPPPEKLESIRGGDKDSKKGAIFELAGQEGGIAGLASSLNEDELNDLIFEFQDDMEFWSTIGIEPPPLTASEDDLAETSLAGEGAGIDTPLTPEDEQISLIGVENGTIV